MISFAALSAPGFPGLRDREKPGAERIAILGLVQVTTAEPVSYAKSRPCFERGMARDAVASATRDAGDIRCEVGIAPVFSWSPDKGIRSRNGKNRTLTPREWWQRSSRLFLPAELADKGVEGRSEKQAEAGHADHSEKHSRSQRLAHLRAGARRHGKRHDAQDKREGCHQDGT
jgi:hypothetical protein